MYSVYQQCGVLAALVLACELVRGLVLDLAYEQPFSLLVFLTVLSSILFWPVVYVVLMRVQTAVRVE